MTDTDARAWTVADLLPDAVSDSGHLYIGLSGMLAKVTGQRLVSILNKSGVSLDDDRPEVRAAVQGVGRMFAHEDSIEIKDEVWPLIDAVEQLVLPPSMAAMAALGELNDGERRALLTLWGDLPDDMTFGEARQKFADATLEARNEMI